jgi:hypothetical protein
LSNSPRRARRRGGGWGSAGAPAEDGASGFSVAARLRQELRRGLAAANGLPLPPVARLGRRLGRDVWVFCSGGRGRRRIIPDEQDGGPRLRQWQATPTAVASHAYGSGKPRLRQWQALPRPQASPQAGRYRRPASPIRERREDCVPPFLASLGFLPWLPSFPLCKSSRIQHFPAPFRGEASPQPSLRAAAWQARRAGAFPQARFGLAKPHAGPDLATAFAESCGVASPSGGSFHPSLHLSAFSSSPPNPESCLSKSGWTRMVPA